MTTSTTLPAPYTVMRRGVLVIAVLATVMAFIENSGFWYWVVSEGAEHLEGRKCKIPDQLGLGLWRPRGGQLTDVAGPASAGACDGVCVLCGQQFCGLYRRARHCYGVPLRQSGYAWALCAQEHAGLFFCLGRGGLGRAWAAQDTARPGGAGTALGGGYGQRVSRSAGGWGDGDALCAARSSRR